eukprot:TRINITY_DN55253_c0_g1_i1.p1 TRINITY_DN55253_c0_g1~~TRINITY_DN55253_c0_g1_i1.p1  ORF type:complete len:717 (-),score=79.01 TRINITY_DN55253_c0_g1_i1:79-2229(-)
MEAGTPSPVKPLQRQATECDDTDDAQQDLNQCLVRLMPLSPELATHDITATTPPVRFGRSPELAQTCRFDSPRISGVHCEVAVDASNTVWVEDKSSNGTYINGEKIGKGNKRKLSHGDTLALQQPGRAGPCFLVNVPATFAKATTPPPTSTSSSTTPQPMTPPLATTTTTASPATTTANTPPAPVTPSGTTQPATSPLPQSGGEGGEQQNSSSDKKRPPPKSAKPRPAKKPKDTKYAKSNEEIGNNLTCGICQQIFYKPISCIPCLHTFCAPCYSQWMDRSDKCPQCRDTVEEIRKNHLFANLTDTFLAANPSKKRTEDEVKELEKLNKVTAEMLTAKKKKKRRDSYSEEEDSEMEDEEDTTGSESEGNNVQASGGFVINGPFTGFGGFGGFGTNPFAAPSTGFGAFGGGGFGFNVAPAVHGPSVGFGQNPWTPGKPSVCKACNTPDKHGYQCSGAKPHHLCILCKQLFPDRGEDETIPNQCSCCQQYFCELYWGCASATGKGSLVQLQQHPMDLFPPDTFGGNKFEIDILIDYIKSQGITSPDVWKECMTKLAAGQWIPTLKNTLGPAPGSTSTSSSSSSSSSSVPTGTGGDDAQPPPTSTTTTTTTTSPAPPAAPSPAPGPSTATQAPTPPTSGSSPKHTVTELQPTDLVCARCAHRVYIELLPKYRMSLDPSKLPPAVIARPDCWYGKNCRTQFHKPHHAKQFNHICSQSKGN